MEIKTKQKLKICKNILEICKNLQKISISAYGKEVKSTKLYTCKRFTLRCF